VLIIVDAVNLLKNLLVRTFSLGTTFRCNMQSGRRYLKTGQGYRNQPGRRDQRVETLFDDWGPRWQDWVRIDRRPRWRRHLPTPARRHALQTLLASLLTTQIDQPPIRDLKRYQESINGRKGRDFCKIVNARGVWQRWGWKNQKVRGWLQLNYCPVPVKSLRRRKQ
jgi:hypothetical protein